MCLNAFDKAADLDVLSHPILNFFYYLVCLHLVMLSHFYNVEHHLMQFDLNRDVDFAMTKPVLRH